MRRNVKANVGLPSQKPVNRFGTNQPGIGDGLQKRKGVNIVFMHEISEKDILFVGKLPECNARSHGCSPVAGRSNSAAMAALRAFYLCDTEIAATAAAALGTAAYCFTDWLRAVYLTPRSSDK
jgi:hypothetical protein